MTDRHDFHARIDELLGHAARLAAGPDPSHSAALLADAADDLTVLEATYRRACQRKEVSRNGDHDAVVLLLGHALETLRRREDSHIIDFRAHEAPPAEGRNEQEPDDEYAELVAFHPRTEDVEAEVARRVRVPRWRAGRAQPGVLAAIAAGGALGAPARYEVAQLIHVPAGGFPWATFWTNVSGSLALGFVLTLLIERLGPTRYARPFLAIGFLGAYTTFSTYMVETDVLAKDGHVLIAATYLIGSTVAGLLAVFAGIAVGRLLPLRHREP